MIGETIDKGARFDGPETRGDRVGVIDIVPAKDGENALLASTALCKDGFGLVVTSAPTSSAFDGGR